MKAQKKTELIEDRAMNHVYDLGTVSLAVSQVVDNHSSLRGASKNLRLFANPGERVPAHSTIHNWIMNLGVGIYIKRPRTKYHTFMIDDTIDFGQEKLLLILGVRHSDIEAGKLSYKHQDVDVLRMKVFNRIDAATVQDFLVKTSNRQGAPRQIISDHGSNIKRGIINFQEDHPETVYTYDVTHKCAILLKHVMEKDDDWLTFCAECGDCRRKVINTEMLVYGPPQSRNKSRHMNLDRYIEWTDKILYVANLKENRLNKKFQDSFGWVLKYKKKLKIWKQMLCVLNAANREISVNGLSGQTQANFENEISQFEILNDYSKDLNRKIIEYIKLETEPIPEGEVWPGSSDVIESVFGRFKYYASLSPVREITRMVMAVPIFTCNLTRQILKEVLECKTVKNSLKWVNNNIGESFIKMRRYAFRSRRLC